MRGTLQVGRSPQSVHLVRRRSLAAGVVVPQVRCIQVLDLYLSVAKISDLFWV